MRPSPRTLAVWLLGVALPGAVCGAAFGLGSAQQATMGAPTGWTRSLPRASYVSPGLLGELDPAAGAWSLSRFEGLVREGGVGTLEVMADIPDPGEIQIYVDTPDARSLGGPSVVVRRGGRASGAVVVEPGRGEQVLPCTGDAGAAATGPTTITVRIGPDGFEADTPGGTLTCGGRHRGGGVGVGSGLGRIRVRSLDVDQVPAEQPPGSGVPGAALGAVIALLTGGLLAWLGVSTAGIAIALAPLFLSALLMGDDPTPVYELARVPHREGVWQIAGLAGLAPTLLTVLTAVAWSLAGRFANASARAWGTGAIAGLLAAGLVARGPQGFDPMAGGALLGVLGLITGAARLLSRGPSPASALAATATLALGGALLGMPVDAGVGRLYAALVFVCIGGVVWLTRHAPRVRLYNLAAFAAAAGSLGALEIAVRWTELGSRWNGRSSEQSGSADTVISQFEALEAGDFTDYPSAGFPARYSPRAAPVRIVSMGGSSTGGAFQNDDLADFYPARLDALVRPQAEVVNQGAGSWNSFHVRAYGEHWLPQADADIVTVYLSVNEAQLAPVTYRELHRRWQDGRLRTTPGLLSGLRLIHGMRYLSRGLRRAGEFAVPPDHFEDNLRDLSTRVTGSGGRVLLMPEAAYPSAETFASYRARMITVAEDIDGVEFLDTSALLADGGAAFFLDQNHLTAAGHTALAAAMRDEMERLGWLQRP